MSFRVSVACEDHTYDQYILRPVVGALLAELGKPRATVHVVTTPRLTGFSRLKSEACNILERYGPVSDLLIFAADLDCDDGQDGRPDKSAALTDTIESCPSQIDASVVVMAQQEIEVWCLWGARDLLPDPWAVVREECDPKEMYFEPLLTSADVKMPGMGRKRLIEASLSSGWQSIRTGCSELAELEQSVREVISA